MSASGRSVGQVVSGTGRMLSIMCMVALPFAVVAGQGWAGVSKCRATIGFGESHR